MSRASSNVREVMRKGRNRWVAFGWVSRKAKGVACRRVHYRKWMMEGGMERKLRGKNGCGINCKNGGLFLCSGREWHEIKTKLSSEVSEC